MQVARTFLVAPYLEIPLLSKTWHVKFVVPTSTASTKPVDSFAILFSYICHIPLHIIPMQIWQICKYDTAMLGNIKTCACVASGVCILVFWSGI